MPYQRYGGAVSVSHRGAPGSHRAPTLIVVVLLTFPHNWPKLQTLGPRLVYRATSTEAGSI